MKKLLFVFLLSISSVVHAEWKLIDSNDSANFYIDITTIQTINNYKRVWQKDEYRDKLEGMFSSRSYMEFDCKEKKLRRLSFEGFKQSNLIDSFVFTKQPREWMFAPPSSVSLRILNFVCSSK